jgi:hypothetical protein
MYVLKRNLLESADETVVLARAEQGIDEESFTFCLDGEVMHQLLQGFRSEKVANEVMGKKFNCGATIRREEIVDGQAFLDVELLCECADADAQDPNRMRMQGDWRIAVGLKN